MHQKALSEQTCSAHVGPLAAGTRALALWTDSGHVTATLHLAHMFPSCLPAAGGHHSTLGF